MLDDTKQPDHAFYSGKKKLSNHFLVNNWDKGILAGPNRGSVVNLIFS